MTFWAWILFLVGCVTWVIWWGLLSSLLEDGFDYTRGKIWALVGLLVVSVLLDYVALFPLQLRTALQPEFMWLGFKAMGYWIPVVGAIAVVAVVGIVAGAFELYKKVDDLAGGVVTVGGFLVAVLAVIWLLGYAILADSWNRASLYGQLSYEVHAASELPSTTALRFLPLGIAERCAQNRLQEPGIQLGEAQPVIEKDAVLWQLPRVPNGFFNSAYGHSDGFALVDNACGVKMARQEMQYGEGMWGTDNLIRHLRASRYWSSIVNVYYAEDRDGNVMAVAPYEDYRFDFPVMVPKWGGVFIVHHDGTTENLSPEKAAADPRLVEIPVFPEKLARAYVEAYSYQHGIRNVLFTHKDQISIPSDQASSNQMPFLVPTENGPKWLVATTAWGGHGISKIFLVDAKTGAIELYDFGRDSSLIGPAGASGYVRTAFPYVDWTRFVILEPRPIIQKGTLYWMFTVTPNDYSGIADSVLVNAGTFEVTSFGREPDQLARFLRGEGAGSKAGAIGGTPPPGLRGGVSPDRVRETINGIRKQLDDLERSLDEKR